MATSDYGTLSRGSPDSLQGYIEDDYDCCTLVSAGTDTNENEVDHLSLHYTKVLRHTQSDPTTNIPTHVLAISQHSRF